MCGKISSLSFSSLTEGEPALRPRRRAGCQRQLFFTALKQRARASGSGIASTHCAYNVFAGPDSWSLVAACDATISHTAEPSAAILLRFVGVYCNPEGRGAVFFGVISIGGAELDAELDGVSSVGGAELDLLLSLLSDTQPSGSHFLVGSVDLLPEMPSHHATIAGSPQDLVRNTAIDLLRVNLEPAVEGLRSPVSTAWVVLLHHWSWGLRARIRPVTRQHLRRQKIKIACRLIDDLLALRGRELSENAARASRRPPLQQWRRGTSDEACMSLQELPEMRQYRCLVSHLCQNSYGLAQSSDLCLVTKIYIYIYIYIIYKYCSDCSV